MSKRSANLLSSELRLGADGEVYVNQVQRRGATSERAQTQAIDDMYPVVEDIFCTERTEQSSFFLE